MPRVRCACGNPLSPPVAMRGTPATKGTPWPGCRPGQVVAVTPAPQAITDFTIIDVTTRTRIERRTGHDVRRGRALPAPVRATYPRRRSRRPSSPAGTGAGDVPPAPPPEPPPLVPREPGVSPDPDIACPWDVSSPGDMSPPPPSGHPTGPPPGEPSPENPGGLDEAGPDAVPDSPDAPDEAGLIPEDPAGTSILGTPTDVFGH